MSKSTLLLFPSCLSHLPLTLTCMPTYTPSPFPATFSSQCERPLACTHAFGSQRHTSSCGRLPPHSCCYYSSSIDSILIGCLRKGGWVRREVAHVISGRCRHRTSVLLLAGRGEDVLYACVYVFGIVKKSTHMSST